MDGILQLRGFEYNHFPLPLASLCITICIPTAMKERIP